MECKWRETVKYWGGLSCTTLLSSSSAPSHRLGELPSVGYASFDGAQQAYTCSDGGEVSNGGSGAVSEQC